MRIVIGLIIGVFGFTSAAHGARLSSPAIFAAHTQGSASCIVFNSGTEPADITVKILNESGGVHHSLRFSLSAGRIGAVSTIIDFGVAFACTVDASSIASLRAVLVINESPLNNHRPIRSAPLR
jgi:hypothetical protein